MFLFRVGFAIMNYAQCKGGARYEEEIAMVFSSFIPFSG